MTTLSGVARKHLHSDYAGLQKSLQQEWVFVQQVTPDIGDAFRPVNTALTDSIIPAFFQGVGELIPGRLVTRLPVKQIGVDLPDPTMKAPENCTVSCFITRKNVAALRGPEDFRTVYHSVFLR